MPYASSVTSHRLTGGPYRSQRLRGWRVSSKRGHDRTGAPAAGWAAGGCHSMGYRSATGVNLTRIPRAIVTRHTCLGTDFAPILPAPGGKGKRQKYAAEVPR